MQVELDLPMFKVFATYSVLLDASCLFNSMPNARLDSLLAV